MTEALDQHWLDMNGEEIAAVVRARFGDVGYHVLGHTDVLWSSWEADHTAVVVELSDGRREIIVLSATSVGGLVDLRERLAAYRQAVAATEVIIELHGRGARIPVDALWHAEHAISIAVVGQERHGADRYHLIAHAPLLWDGGHVAVVDLPDGRRVAVPVRAPDYAAEDLPLQARAHADAAARMSEVVRLLEESRECGDSS